MPRERGLAGRDSALMHAIRPCAFRLLFSATAYAALNFQTAAASTVLLNDRENDETVLFNADWVIAQLQYSVARSEAPKTVAPDIETKNIAIERSDLFKIDPALEAMLSPSRALSIPAPLDSDEALGNIPIATLEQSNLEIALSHELGPDAVSKKNHLAHAGLRAGESWNIEADAIWRGQSRDGSSYTTAIGIYTNRQPFLESRGGVGLTDPEFWLQEFTFDTGIQFATKDAKNSVVGGISFSEAGFERHFSHDPWLISLENMENDAPESERSLNSFFALDANLFESERLKLDVSIDFSKSAGRPLGTQSNKLGEILFPGDYLGAEISGEIDDLALQLEAITLRSGSYDLDATNLILSDGRHRLNVSLDRERLKHDNLLIANDESVRLNLRTDLSQVFPGLPSWAPDELQVGAQSTRSGESFADTAQSINQHSIGGGFAKHGDWFYTDIYAFISSRRENAPDTLRYAQKEIGFDIVQELYFDDFDISAYLSVNSMASRRDRLDDASDRSISGGLSISYDPEGAPRMTLSADLYEDTTDLFLDNFSYRSHEYSVQAEVELSRMFKAWSSQSSSRDISFGITLNAYRGWNRYREQSFPIQDAETRGLIRFAKKF